MTNSITIDSIPTSYTTGGNICGSCGVWVSHGTYHACFQPSTYVFVPAAFTSIDSNRLAELMEAERKLKAIERILEDT